MKKYIKPATRWAEMEIEAMIAQSITDPTKTNREVGDEAEYSRELTSSSSLWDKEW